MRMVKAFAPGQVFVKQLWRWRRGRAAFGGGRENPAMAAKRVRGAHLASCKVKTGCHFTFNATR